MQAVKKFDPYKGVKLSSYAAWWIRAYILKYLMDSTSQVRIATTAAQRKLFYNLRKETERLLREYDEVTPKLLADNLNVREQDVLDMQIRLGSPDVSLDEPLSPDSDATREYLLADGSKAVDDVLADGQLLNIFEGHLLEFKSILNGRDLDIFNDRMLAEKPLTLQEIGERYGITRERARQIEARILKNLKEFVKEKGVMQDLMTPTQPAEYR
jgi:RNA polymerase sigma-32 factor